ncbi:complement C4-B [Engraulis encrasicolus]|uniref:complement C4-B n=1 Tax=Engraulis encrasicolus TaxID=184585 RepID=UPI002FCFA3DF
MTPTLLLLLCLSTVLHAQEPRWLITAPNLIHVGVDETVSVQVHGATSPVAGSLQFKRHINAVSENVAVTLNAQNNYQAVVKMKVEPKLLKDAYANDAENERAQIPYIQLVALFPKLSIEAKLVNIWLSEKRGYIFIQTNKPIYTPGETVQYRIFTLDQYMLPADEELNLRIFNSDGLVVRGTLIKSTEILEQTITIPNIERAGFWKIEAHFSGARAPEFISTHFEVKEYVLPQYEVNIVAPKPYCMLSDDSFDFIITARYTYGKSVDGVAYVRFGTVDKQGDKTNIPGLENQLPLKDGRASVKLLTSDLKNKAAERNVTQLEGCHLYIAVTALEKASGNLEEAESSSVKLVASPYVIDMSKTKKYFAPGSTFSILAKTTYPDGTVVPDLKLDAVITARLFDQSEVVTNKEAVATKGEVVIPYEVPQQSSQIHIKLSPQIDKTASQEMTVHAMQGTNCYLSIEVDHRVLGPGQELTAQFRDIVPAGSPRPTHIYYMVLSKGKILQTRSVQTAGREVTEVTVPVTIEMVPSFRLLAYYFSGARGVVADSVWVDVKDVCKGKIEISPLKQYKPADFLNMEVKADSRSKVAMVAVDSAVYILNKQNKLTSQKMFDYMNSYDLACSIGGGQHQHSVFWDVGLIWICNCEFPDKAFTRAAHECPSTPSPRSKRAAIDFSGVVSTLGKDAPQCCSDAVKFNRMGLSCENRLKRVKKPQKCRDVFLKCCKKATEMRKATRKYSLARSDGHDVDEAIGEGDVHLRSYFPESWLWKILETDANGVARHSEPAPDSITTWEIQAVGISPTTGFCVAEPQTLTVFQSFFVSVKLPYSVKKNEQLEVKAVVFNYVDEEMEVMVEMLPTEGLCMARGDRARQSLSIPPNSASSVYFMVVPLTTGKFPITILAHSTSTNTADKIQKELRVEEEGELKKIDQQYIIIGKQGDAPDSSLNFSISQPSDAIPGSEPETYLSFKGGLMGETVDNCLNLEGIENLIRLPTGCTEQTMSSMSPTVHAVEYLDATDQWVNLKADRRDQALSLLMRGYTHLLTYMKSDGAYGSFSSTPKSTWITAYVAKELSKVSRLIPIEKSYIKKSINYVISKQLPGGDFQGGGAGSYLQGSGIGKASGNAAITAYVLIAMNEAAEEKKEVFEVWESTPVKVAIKDTWSYLKQQLPSLQDPYTVAITGYALSLTEPVSADAITAYKKLKEKAICDKDMCFWSREDGRDTKAKATPVSLEATSYALLHTLIMKDMPYAKRIARWITLQRRFGGGFYSTQDTVIALEALSKYSIKANDVDPDLDLNVEMCLQNGQVETRKLLKQNALTQSAIQVRKGGAVSVRVKGRGEGTLSVVQNYRSLKAPDAGCDMFSLSVTLEGEVEYKMVETDNLDDYEYYDDGGQPPADEPMSRMDWFDLRTRRKRQAPTQEKKEGSLIYTVCLGLKSGVSGGMVLVDIALLSGLTANVRDLEENEKSTEKYIDHYDLGSNRVYLYFNEISNTSECLQFRAEQIVPIGLVQPAAAVIYDYSNPDRKCGVFYSAPQKSKMVSKLCDGDVCTCAEGACPTPKVTFSSNMKSSTRMDFACYKPVVNYVYVVKVVSSTADGVFNYYTVEVTRVIKLGKDEYAQSGVTRELVKRLSCVDFELEVEAEYLFMGINEGITHTVDVNGSPRYLLRRDSWLEKLPGEERCRATRNRQACQLLHDFMDKFSCYH